MALLMASFGVVMLYNLNLIQIELEEKRKEEVEKDVAWVDDDVI